MKKLKLNLDEIKVESFETNSVQSKLGTVIGQGGSQGCGPNLPEPAPTAATCDRLLCASDCPQLTCGTCDPFYCYWTGPVECPW